MDIVVKGRNVEVPEHYRVLVTEKLSRLERYDRKLSYFDVELFHEPNRRQHKGCQRVEITTVLRNVAVRAESCAGDFYAALDCAISKLENQLRKMHDRRRVHHGRRTPASLAAAVADARTEVASANGTASSNGQLASARTAVLDQPAEPDAYPGEEVRVPEQRWNDEIEDDLPGRIVREKEHSSKPMSIDQALYEMELVGHDFYLFADVDSGQPSVVYRRRGFAYGLIRLA